MRLSEVSERGRDGITGARKPGAIGFTAMRAGGIVGEHSVVFAAEDEILTLTAKGFAYLIGQIGRDRMLDLGVIEPAL